MEEIANRVYIEDRFPGLVLGAIKLADGLLLVDAPFRNEDIHAWRTTLSSLGGKPNKILVISDTQLDRTFGLRGMESLVVGHQTSVELLQNRSSSARLQDIDPGAAMIPYDLSLNARWMMPDITYTDQISIHLDEDPVFITHHPGSHLAGSWVRFDAAKVLFVGDSVATNQPPFLAWADLDRWIADIELLASDEFRGYKIISARQGRLYHQTISKMTRVLKEIRILVRELAEASEPLEAIKKTVPTLLKQFYFDNEMTDLYRIRLVWGLEKYLQRHYLESSSGG